MKKNRKGGCGQENVFLRGDFDCNFGCYVDKITECRNCLGGLKLS